MTSTTHHSLLRPDPAELAVAWREVVEAEFEQVERLREWQDEAGDHYAPVAQYFADDPHRSGDPQLDLLRSWSRPDASWLDIGAGGGRYALPLALVSRAVLAVEPSPGMREVLRAGMAQHGIANITIHDVRWPEGAGDLRADSVLAAHVGYDIRDISAFLDAMERAARERCVMIAMDRAPSAGFVHLWEQVHGEPRHQLPGLRELLHLLLARGATPEVRITERRFRQMDEVDIRSEARRRLWLSEGSAKDRHLQALLDELLRDGAGVSDFQFPSVIGVVSWTVDVKREKWNKRCV